MQKSVLEISSAALPSWRLLPHCVRWHVAVFPDVSTSAHAYCPRRSVEALTLPAMSRARSDVARVATRLKVAFPRLVRRVTSVAMDGPIVVSLECEGLHEGMWSDMIYPTSRLVTFQEQHDIVVIDGAIVSDSIMLDLPAIVSQLCGNSDVDPDETTRVASPCRENFTSERGWLPARCVS
jgi:hypothetical protein